MHSLPNAKSVHVGDDREKIKRVVIERNLCGLANNTKWDELVNEMRAYKGQTPSYRYKCVDGRPSPWDIEWCYHPPFPLVSVEWLDIAFLIAEWSRRFTPPKITDHSDWIEALLKEIGLDYKKGKEMIRIFGYSPRSLQLFDEQPDRRLRRP